MGKNFGENVKISTKIFPVNVIKPLGSSFSDTQAVLS